MCRALLVKVVRGAIGLVVLIVAIPVLGFSQELLVIWPDIEQGACTLIVGPNGTGVLIDAGTLYSGAPDVPLVEWLQTFARSHRSFHLRYIIATHYHTDHICWIDDVIRAGLLDRDGVVYDRGGNYSERSIAFLAYKTAVRSYRKTISLGQTIGLDGASLQCLVAAGAVYGDGAISTTDENNLSLGFLLAYKDFQLWVGGDLGKEIEILAKDVIGDVDVYVMHHHGSKTSSSMPFLSALKPEITICQVGEKNPYGHPHELTIRSVFNTPDTDGDTTNGTPILILQNRGYYSGNNPRVYIADPDGPGGLPGTIELKTDGTSYTISAPGLSVPISLSTDRAEKAPETVTSTSESVPPATECTLSVILESVELVYNNHVGNDWYLEFFVNGQQVPVYQFGLPKVVWTTTFSEMTTITVKARVIEEDKYPDVGFAMKTFTVTCPSHSQAATLEVLVREDRGRYAGNTALWRFRIRVETSQ